MAWILDTCDTKIPFVHLCFVSESTRKRAVNLVAQAYSSISGDDLAAFMGMATKEAVESKKRICLEM